MPDEKDQMVKVGDNSYPKWAVDRAMGIVKKSGGDLEGTIEAVIAVIQAMKRGLPGDPNGDGYGSSVRILIVPSSWRKKR